MRVLSTAAATICLTLMAIVAAPESARALDAAPFQRVLSAHAKASGFDYAAMHGDAERRADLQAFVTAIGTMSDDEPLSSWLNAYNALVIHAVVERYPIRSVRDVDGFFDTVPHRIAGRMRTLDDLEHRIIRARFPDARVHVALNCGARSCPALPRRVFEERSLDASLTRLARAAVASRQHVRVNADGSLSVSELFFWFSSDFERDGGSVVAWLKRYGGAGLEAVSPDARLTRIPYDWRLNQAR